MTERLAADLRRVFDAAKLGPRPFHDLLTKAETLYEEEIAVEPSAVYAAIRAEGPGGPVRTVMRGQLSRWDFESEAVWAQTTRANTRERREMIYDAMDLTDEDRTVLSEALPFYEPDPITVIASKRWERWYTPERRAGRNYYWEAFSGYLRTIQHWSEESILSLDEATKAVVERLADPSRTAPYQSKGLVVGYVQSGKTANITGVVARAGDAGYRLVIILAGTQNMLRNQTQRRLDKELLGAELVEDEYLDDADWDSFLRHGGRPSTRGSFDWIRLTGRWNDYHRLPAGAIETLKFPRVDLSARFNEPQNLYAANAKLIVVKKNAAVLDKLARDLARVNGLNELVEVPALVIDDESDQASVNTVRPPVEADEETERTRINKAIVDLLGTLPRGQYVGYTATPFANVFVDPADAEDLFPRDFIVSLRRPPGYLGASDFHDLEGLTSETGAKDYISNERAYVRAVYGGDATNTKLQRAIDSFILSGALKLYREPQSGWVFRHHTMIVHTSHLTADHREQLALVRSLLTEGGYQTGDCRPRLRELFANDFQPVSKSRAPDLPYPSSFEELDNALGEVVGRLHAGNNPVLLVNSNADADQLAFDAEPVWKIIVGGSKLSRGFTVEGLTISYFRRRSPTADTLMQMGRWCGFRSGYLDLVRLFIGRTEPGNLGEFDLYEAFEAICRDEDSFRKELWRYAMPSDDNEPLTPRDVPPLVASHLDWIRPTSRNKMYNATIGFRNFGGRPSEHRLAPTDDDDIAFNEQLFRTFLQSLDLEEIEFEADDAKVRAIVGLASMEATLALLEHYRWHERRKLLAAELEFLSGDQGDPEIDDWAVVLPQLQRSGSKAKWSLGGLKLSVHFRNRFEATNLVNAYAGPEDRKVAAVLSGAGNTDYLNAALDALRIPRRGVLLLYPIAHVTHVTRDWVPTMGFTLVFPPNSIRRQIGFVVKNPQHPDEPVVPA
jgi:hypothetical protein